MVRRRIARARGWIVVLSVLLLLVSVACAQMSAAPGDGVVMDVPTMTAAPSATTTAPPLPVTSESTRTPAPTASMVVATPTATPEPIATVAVVPRPLAPIEPLAATEILDRPLREVRSLTDGERSYRLAVWSPTGPYIALLPQDGPGLDLIDTRDGEVTSVVSDTFVLEPVWTDTGELLIHQTENGRDRLVLFDPERGFAREPLVVGAPLAAPSYAAETVAFVRDDEVLICGACANEPMTVATGGALVTALATRAGHPWLAWTPRVSDLEQVRTVIMPLDGTRESWALSEVGEGLWLPRWSPDGDLVALTGIGGRLVIAAIDGSARYDLGPGDAPAWSPDGSLIAFNGASAGLDYTTRDIHLIRSDGSGNRLRLTSAGPEELYLSPSWSPDGRQLAFVELDTGRLFVGIVAGLP